ncbi:MAG: NlpC/P60 family protein [Burkholderiaceae bacterium]
MIERSAWVATLLGYERTPYAHQGRLPGVGLDCVGPLICAARTLGIVEPGFDIADYSRQPDGSLQPYLDAHLTRKPRAELGLGDVVLNAFRLGPPQHIAVIVGERWGEWVMLHANSLVGRVMCERLPYERRWYRYVQGYAVSGVAP